MGRNGLFFGFFVVGLAADLVAFLVAVPRRLAEDDTAFFFVFSSGGDNFRFFGAGELALEEGDEET